jgi:glycerophosphoryl diester phosphodiesterase
MGLDIETLKSRIYCHRGYWASAAEQNTVRALEDAAGRGFGIETDIRDYQGSIVVSHDPVRNSCFGLEKLLKTSTPVALNVKSDGLLSIGHNTIKDVLQTPGSFLFDGSIPEMLRYRQHNLPHALRISEYESDIAWESQYVWLDSFQSDWWIENETLKRLTEKHFVVVVSPELHGRPSHKVWDIIATELISGNPNLGICTDFPERFAGMLE